MAAERDQGSNRLGKRVSPFDALPPGQKIDLLIGAVPSTPMGTTHPHVLIHVGGRRMSRWDSLCSALEIALEFQRDRAPEVSRMLLQEYPATGLRFPLFGARLSRERLVEWLSHEATGGRTFVSPRRRWQAMESQLRQGNSQNVHIDAVRHAMREQLMVMRERVPPAAMLSLAAAEAELTRYLRTQQHAKAKEGMDYVVARPELISQFGESPRGALAILWSYIRSVPDKTLRAKLASALSSRLAEICDERPCQVGTIERIIDVPTGIDWSLTNAVCYGSMREEMRQMANAACEEVDREWGQDTNEVPGSAEDEAMHELLGDMKRERFYAMADADFVMLRGLPRALVAAEARKVFPENWVP